MAKRIITISREFGSGGRYIGEETAKRIGIAFYDKEIISELAKKTGFSQDYIEQKGEQAPFKNFFAYGLVGRNADYILRERQDVLNVFISGNMPQKINRIEKLYNKTREEAKKMIHDVDKRRSINYKYYTEQTWGMASNYMLCLNSSELGYERCESILTELYRTLS